MNGSEGARPKGRIEILAELITSPSAGRRLVEAAGDLIAEDARFNRWVYERKPRSTTAEMWSLAAQAVITYQDPEMPEEILDL